MKNFLAGIIN